MSSVRASTTVMGAYLFSLATLRANCTAIPKRNTIPNPCSKISTSAPRLAKTHSKVTLPMNRFHGFFLALAAFALLGPALGHAQEERLIRFGHLNNPDHPVSAGVKKFAELVAQK